VCTGGGGGATKVNRGYCLGVRLHYDSLLGSSDGLEFFRMVR
jgi:hypothetical protein